MAAGGRASSVVVVLVLALAASTRTGAAAGASDAAGAVYTDEFLGGMETVWGHDATAAGADSIGEEALARVDLLRGVRDHTKTAGCRRALDNLLLARSQLKVWALKMHSSSVVLPDAVLSGATSHMGDYDACLSVPEAMYCLMNTDVRPLSAVRATPHPGDELSPFDPPNGANASLWDLLKTSGNIRRFRRDHQEWALCLPAQCGQADAQDQSKASRSASPEGARQLGLAVADTISGMARSLGVQIRVNLVPTDCYMNHAQDPDEPSQLHMLLTQPAFLFGSAFILIFPALTLVATAWHIVQNCIASSTSKKQGISTSIMQCFVIQRNWENLCRRQQSQIHSIQGLRVLSMIGVVSGHRMLGVYGGPVLNPEYYEDFFTQPSKMILVGGTGIVATFFVIMAFLEARTCMAIYETHSLSWKLAPAMAFMVAFDALWLEHLGSGPLWNQMIAGGEAALCKTLWWENMLFISNYVGPGIQCLMQTWFLSASMQMYLATPLVMWVVFRCTRRALWPGCAVLGLLLAVSVFILYERTAALGLLPTLPLYPMFLRRGNLVKERIFTHQYLPTHTNLIPYVVGLLAGTLFYLANRWEWKPSQRVRWSLLAGIPLTASLQVGAAMAGLVYLNPSGRQPLLESLYGPARQLAYAVPTAWLIFTCGIGCGGVASRALSWTPFLSLGRLSYSVFLVHVPVILGTAACIRQPLYFRTTPFIRIAAGDVFLSYAFGFLLYICVEAPVSNVIDLLTKQAPQKSEKKS